jgi:uncharacterized membrane protein
MKKYIITGLLIWIPLAITIWVLHLIVTTMDQTLTLLPFEFRPAIELFGRTVYIPGLGVIATILAVFLTGVFGSNILGQRLITFWENLLGRIPVVKTLYHGVKQVSDTMFAPGGQAFRKALLVQYPRAGCWTIAFQTGQPGGDVAAHLQGEHVSVYVPTTPNPTSGFFLMMPKSEVVELDMSVDDALKYVISMGVVVPGSRNGRKGQ